WANSLVPDLASMAVAAEGARVMIDGAGATADSLIIRPGAQVRIVAGATLSVRSVTILAGGTLRVDDQATLDAVDLNVEQGASLIWQGGRIHVTGDYRQAQDT